MEQVAKLITDNLDIWSSAIKQKSASGRGKSNKLELYGIKKLRELILDLAVRGKLVPQDPSDEPASELLKKIAAEKARLVTEGKIKKQKPLPPITDEEKPFELPDGWIWSRLGEISGANTGYAFKSSEYTNKGVFVLRVTNINSDGSISQSDCKYISSEMAEKNYSKFSLKKDDLLLVMVGGSLGKIGVVSNHVLPAVLNQNMWKMERYGSVSVDYLRYGLEFINRNQIEITKSTHGHLSQSQYLEKLVPFMPIEEQHRIVAKVDELMALCDQLEQQQENSITAHQTLVETLLGTLTNSKTPEEFQENWARIAQHFDTLFTTEHSINQLKQTILQLAVMGKLVPFSENSLSCKVKDILSFGPRNGFSPKEVEYETTYQVLKLGATSYGALDLSQTKQVDIQIEDDSHLWLKAGDILVQRGNSHVFVGSNVLINSDLEKTIYPDLMMKLRVTEVVIPQYLSLWLKSPTARNYMWQRMTGTSGTMPKISKKVVEQIPIIVPPLIDQQKLVEKVAELMALWDELLERIKQAQQTQLHLTDTMAEKVSS